MPPVSVSLPPPLFCLFLKTNQLLSAAILLPGTPKEVLAFKLRMGSSSLKDCEDGIGGKKSMFSSNCVPSNLLILSYLMVRTNL